MIAAARRAASPEDGRHETVVSSLEARVDAAALEHHESGPVAVPAAQRAEYPAIGKEMLDHSTSTSTRSCPRTR